MPTAIMLLRMYWSSVVAEVMVGFGAGTYFTSKFRNKK